MMGSARKHSASSRRREDEASSSSLAAAAAAAEEEEPAEGMEASRFGFLMYSGFPACKFNPTDADIVASYLLRAMYGPDQFPSPYPAGAVIEDDAARCEPWALMRDPGHATSAHAFFVRDDLARAASSDGDRRRRVPRAVKNGWHIQKTKEATLTILRDGGGGELDVGYKRRHLSFHRAGESTSTGWVMHEYEITSPALPGTVLSRIRATPRARAKDKKPEIKKEPSTSTSTSVAGECNAPCQCSDRPGLSHQYSGAKPEPHVD
uniref:NAC domain-containing protein n=1 Tax=Oryza brachyantha TaxID=4533 RepID=J3N6G3_ORYBR